MWMGEFNVLNDYNSTADKNQFSFLVSENPLTIIALLEEIDLIVGRVKKI